MVVEPNPRQAQLLAVAIERCRPGTVVTVAAGADSAAQVLQALKQTKQTAQPAMVIFGAGLPTDCCGEAIQIVRKTLAPSAVPIVALRLDSQRAPPGVDASYHQPAQWEAFRRVAAKLLDEWLK